MKKLIFSLSFLMLGLVAFAQNNNSAQAKTDELSQFYQLDDAQKAQMLEIQQRRDRNMSEIAVIKDSDKRVYRHKCRAIQQSTDASIRRILKEDQMEQYNQRRIEWRKKRAAKVSELKESGATAEEIEDALLEVNS